tara:strand:+ start:176 stop:355 length:180 start_codon:yes stop_codon:yes gene_type:complete
MMKYYGGWSFFEAYNLPVPIRRWFLNRLIRQKDEEQEARQKNASSAAPGNRRKHSFKPS